jgi:hypothetical protein
MISQETENILMNPATVFSKKSNNIPNDSKAVEQDRDIWEAICTMIGIDFGATGYTIRVVIDDSGSRTIYAPYIAKDSDGVPSIFWGNVILPLAESQAVFTIESEEKRLYAELEMGEECYQFALMTPKENRPDRTALRKAFKAGKLGDLLTESFNRSLALTDLPVGDYMVTGYSAYKGFEGKQSYTITIDGQAYKANSRVHKELDKSPEVSPEAPAILVVLSEPQLKSIGGTDRLLANIRFTTYAATKAPAFSF